MRTQISAFLAGTFFAVILVFITQEHMRTPILSGDVLYILTITSLAVTFATFAFSTFAFGLSADFFRASVEKNVESLKQKAKEAFLVGITFFKAGYFSMMWSFTFVLAHAHLLFGLFGFLVFVGLWEYLWRKTGPYDALRDKKA